MKVIFRGMSKTTKEWVYGDLVQVRGVMYILNIEFLSIISLPTSKFIEVKPETVGQYVGLIDKKKINIYIGDIVKEDFYISRLVDGISTDSRDLLSGTKWETEKQEEVFVVKSLIQIYKYVQDIVDISDDKDVKKYKKGKMLRIIGNIFENPELLPYNQRTIKKLQTFKNEGENK